jgi:hypothetical protein
MVIAKKTAYYQGLFWQYHKSYRPPLRPRAIAESTGTLSILFWVHRWGKVSKHQKEASIQTYQILSCTVHNPNRQVEAV